MSTEQSMDGTQSPEGNGVSTQLPSSSQQDHKTLNEETEEAEEEITLVQQTVNQEEEGRLLLRIMQGDTDATDVLFRRIYPPILDHFRGKLSKTIYFRQAHERAQDMTQETITRTWRKIADYKPQPGKSFLTYVYGFARNVWHEMWHSLKRDELTDYLESLPLAQEPMDEQNQPENVYIESEQQKELRQALASLPFKDRELVRLRHQGRTSVSKLGSSNCSVLKRQGH